MEICPKYSNAEEATNLAVKLWPFAHGNKLTAATVADLTSEIGCSRATLFRLVAKLRKTKDAHALIPRKPGRRALSRSITPVHEKIIQDCIKNHFLVLDVNSPSELIKRISAECETRGVSPISRTAIQARINEIPPRDLLKRQQGNRAAREQYDLVKKRYEVDHPLGVVQIDHTPLDVIVYDGENQPLGRPNLTVIIDIFSRAILGFHIDICAPNVAVLMTAFSNAIFPKQRLLEELRIKANWPMFGMPETVHTDNGPDLTSKAFTSGLGRFGIKHIKRPIGAPNWGGHIERVFRTQNSYIHFLPGATGSNVNERNKRRPEVSASLSIFDLRRIFASYVCNCYNLTHHDGIGQTPLRKWENYWKTADARPYFPEDLETFKFAFMPKETRKIGPYGLRFNNLYFRSPELQKMRNNGHSTVEFRYNHEDCRTIYLIGHNGSIIPAHCEDQYPNPVTISELQSGAIKSVSGNKKWADANLAEHFALHDQIVARAKKNKLSSKRKTPSSKVLPQKGALKPSALLHKFTDLGDGNVQ